MILAEALSARLAAAGAVTAIVGTRIYWNQRPQGTEVPAIVLNYVGGFEVENLESDTADTFSTNLRVDCFGINSLQSKQIAVAVRNALKPAGSQGGFEFDDSTISRPIDLGEFGVPGWQHRATLDCVIRHGAES
jgi:hypothetical protein